MVDNRKAAIEDLEQLVEAAAALEAGVRHATVQYRMALASLRDGLGVKAALDGARSADTRQALTAALETFEKRRHVSRLSLIAAGSDEGMSINSVSRVWGISRQLASRYVNLVQANPGSP
ncbi:MAG: hypothetical protein ACLQPH_09975 [Acidimicrobiales bacterium]